MILGVVRGRVLGCVQDLAELEVSVVAIVVGVVFLFF